MADRGPPAPRRHLSDKAWRAELSGSLALAWPLVLMQLAQISINATLMIMVGRQGATELAGTALGLQTFLLVFLFSLGLAIAVAPMVAQARGAGELRQIRRSVRQGLWATTLIAVPGGLLLWFSGPILRAAGQDPQVTAAAADFARPLAFGLAPWLWFFVLRNYMAAMNRPRPALYVMIAAILLNGLLGYVLVFGQFGLPAMDALGAGITAALVGWFLPLALLAFALTDRHLRRLSILARFWRPDWQAFREIFRLGTPIGLAMLLESTLFMAMLYLQGLVSTVAQAAHAVTMQLAAMAFMVPLGVSQAATVRVGLAVGQRDASAARRAALVAFALSGGCAVIGAVIFLLLPTTVVRLYLDLSLPESTAVLATGLTFLAIAAVFQLFDGLQVVALGILRGLKDTRVPTLITCLGYWGLGFPLAILLGLYGGLEGAGIWLGITAGLAVGVLLMVWRVRRSLASLEGTFARLPPAPDGALVLPA